MELTNLDTRVSTEDLKETGTLKSYNEWRDYYACRIVLNWVKAGVTSNAELDIRENLLQLEMPELVVLMLESQDLVAKYGLPLVFRLL